MKVLLLNQTFYPDVASTAQHASDLAAKLAECGYQVTALASCRAYDNPNIRFRLSELWRGVSIQRIRASGFGKKARWRRSLDFASFLGNCLFRLTTLPRFDVVVALTSPPLVSFLAALFVKWRGGRLIFWVMDLNPDEAIAAGWLRERSQVARLLKSLLHYSLRVSEKIVVLDRFMARRILDKGIPEHKIVILPPWSHDHVVRYDSLRREAFRREHGLTGKYVVMYSGNHSPCHPLDTLLETARRLSGEPDIVFCFVGGGSEFKKVQQYAARHNLQNIFCLPYQPLDKLAASLSSADLHVVVMGDPFIGLVHPCKIYNILNLGIPFLYIGPSPSHVTELIHGAAHEGYAYLARHGDVDRIIEHLDKARTSGRSNGGEQIKAAGDFSQDVLLARMVEVLESAYGKELLDCTPIMARKNEVKTRLAE